MGDPRFWGLPPAGLGHARRTSRWSRPVPFRLDDEIWRALGAGRYRASWQSPPWERANGNFATIYRQGVTALGRVLGIPRQEAASPIEQSFVHDAHVRRWLDRRIDEAHVADDRAGRAPGAARVEPPLRRELRRYAPTVGRP